MGIRENSEVYDYEIRQNNGNVLQAKAKVVLPYRETVEIVITDIKNGISHYILYDTKTKEELRYKQEKIKSA